MVCPCPALEEGSCTPAGLTGRRRQGAVFGVTAVFRRDGRAGSDVEDGVAGDVTRSRPGTHAHGVARCSAWPSSPPRLPASRHGELQRGEDRLLRRQGHRVRDRLRRQHRRPAMRRGPSRINPEVSIGAVPSTLRMADLNSHRPNGRPPRVHSAEGWAVDARSLRIRGATPGRTSASRH